MLNIFKRNNDLGNKNLSEDFELDMNNIPKHIAIIMDGNGRWAQARNLPRSLGHKAGVETIRRVIKEADKLGVKYMTFYAFSTENWKRPKDEINALMKLLVQYLRKELDELHENKVCIKVLGDISRLPNECISEINRAVEKTKDNTGIVMSMALNYGGRDEIIRGIKKLIIDEKEGKINIDDINKDMFNNYLYTANMPDPDLIIRPSGEQRLSNFLLWQCAYSEFWYSNINWPDFNEKDLRKAIFDFQKRNRRYGGI